MTQQQILDLVKKHTGQVPRHVSVIDLSDIVGEPPKADAHHGHEALGDLFRRMMGDESGGRKPDSGADQAGRKLLAMMDADADKAMAAKTGALRKALSDLPTEGVLQIFGSLVMGSQCKCGSPEHTAQEMAVLFIQPIVKDILKVRYGK